MVDTLDRFRPGRIGTAALIVGGGILVSRLLGQVREIVFAGLLGADEITDQYVAAFRIPDFANYLLAGGFLAITFIPIFSKYLADHDEAEGWRAFTAILRPLAIGIVALVAVAWVVTPFILEAIYPNFTSSQLETTTRLTRIILPAQVFFVVGGMFTAVQFAKGVFWVPTLAPVIYNLAIIAGGVGYAVVTGAADPEGFVWGALIGAFLGNFALQAWGARRIGMQLEVGVAWWHPAVKQYLLLALPLMLGLSIVVMDEMFMSIFGDMVSDGAQTQLQYARRTMLVPVGIIAQAAAVAAYPFLARLFAEGRVAEMNWTVDRTLQYVLVLGIGAAGLLTALSVPVVRTLFERGSFTQGDSSATAAALFFYALAIPIWGGLAIITRAFYARRDMWTPVLVGTAVTVAAVPLYFLLQDAFDLRGVAVASTLSLATYVAVLAGIWYRWRVRRSRLGGVLESALRAVPLTVVGALAGFVVGWALYENLPGQATIVNLVAALLGGLTFLTVAVALGAALHDLLTWRQRRGQPRTEDRSDVMEVLG